MADIKKTTTKHKERRNRTKHHRKPQHGKHGARTDRKPLLESDECSYCGRDECECHEIVTGFPANCPSD
jgi:hypothetical protein